MLGLELRPHGERLRLFDPESQRWLPTPQEETAARRAAEVRATTAEARAAVEADARQAEADARQVAEARMATEAEARQAAEAELARLRAQLDKLNPS